MTQVPQIARTSAFASPCLGPFISRSLDLPPYSTTRPLDPSIPLSLDLSYAHSTPRRQPDIQSSFARRQGREFTIDGAHLNEAGARLVAEVLSEHLRAVLI